MTNMETNTQSCIYKGETKLMMEKVVLSDWNQASVNSRWWFVRACVCVCVCVCVYMCFGSVNKACCWPGLSPVRPSVNHQLQRRGDGGGGIQRNRSRREIFPCCS